MTHPGAGLHDDGAGAELVRIVRRSVVIDSDTGELCRLEATGHLPLLELTIGVRILTYSKPRTNETNSFKDVA